MSCTLLHTIAHCYTLLHTTAHNCTLLHTTAHYCTLLHTTAQSQSKQTNFVHGFMLMDLFLPCWLNNQTSALYTPLYIFAVSLQTGFSWQCTCSQTGLFLDCSSRKPFPVQTLSPCGPGWVGVSSLRASGLSRPPLLCPSACWLNSTTGASYLFGPL